SSRRRHTRFKCDWSSDVCSSDLATAKTDTGTIVLASDNVYLYENLEKHVPIAQTLDAASNLKAQDRIRMLVSDPRLIVPGHDPRSEERRVGRRADVGGRRTRRTI